MATPTGSILPQSYFDGLSTLWGGCAFLGSAIVAAGLVFHAARSRPEPTEYLWLFTKVLLIGIATLFIREWLMRLNDVVMGFITILGVDPHTVDEKFVTFISGKTPAAPNASVWDVIWGTKSIGTAICYALLWLFGWLSWGLQYIVKLIGGVLLTAGWALSPVFLAFFMIRPMVGVARKYVLGLVALVCWPFGWAIAAVVTNAMIDATATASLLPVIVSGSIIAPALCVLLVGAWMMLSAVLAPYVTTRVLLMGANPASALAQSVGGVAEAAVAGGVGGAAAAITGGAAAAGVVTAAAVGAMASASESAGRGGGAARVTSMATAGVSGMYGGAYARRRTAAYETAASAFSKMADSAESMAASQAEQAEVFREMKRRMGRQRTERAAQPHHPNPNQAALEIEAYAKN